LDKGKGKRLHKGVGKECLFFGFLNKTRKGDKGTEGFGPFERKKSLNLGRGHNRGGSRVEEGGKGQTA